MLKNDLLTAIKEKTNMTKKDIAMVLDATEEVVKEALAKGEKVTVVGVQFATKVQPAKEGICAINGQPYSTPEKTVPKVKATKALKDAVL